MSSFQHALEQFEATEANIGKLERLCDEIRALIPSGIEFGFNTDYDDKCRSAEDICAHLPLIDGWKPEVTFADWSTVAQTRFDLLELDEPSADISFENSLDEPQQQVRDYRFRFNRKRRALVRSAMERSIDEIDKILRDTAPAVEDLSVGKFIPEPALSDLRAHYKEIHVLLGSSAPRPDRWQDMGRHLHFGQTGDFHDIVNADWPAAKVGLRATFYGQDEAIPVAVADLGELVASAPSGPIPTKLNWSALTDETFERLIFALISGEAGYENPEWLTPTRAPDRGRDLAVMRITRDGLSGQMRSRVIIQCKHWQTKSVSAADVATLKEQMTLWEPPRVDVLIIATTGRFSTDAVQTIEKQSQSDRVLKIEMWADSHLEMLLAARPALIAEFDLR